MSGTERLLDWIIKGMQPPFSCLILKQNGTHPSSSCNIWTATLHRDPGGTACRDYRSRPGSRAVTEVGGLPVRS